MVQPIFLKHIGYLIEHLGSRENFLCKIILKNKSKLTPCPPLTESCGRIASFPLFILANITSPQICTNAWEEITQQACPHVCYKLRFCGAEYIFMSPDGH